MKIRRPEGGGIRRPLRRCVPIAALVAAWPSATGIADETNPESPAPVRPARTIEPAVSDPDRGFRRPEGIVFVGDDCSVYVSERPDAWGVCFRVGEESRAYTEFDLPCPAKIGRKLYALDTGRPGTKPELLLDAGAGALGSPSVAYDGRTVYVSMARAGDSFFHIYRLPAAGGEPRRLTDGPFHDLDPVELPDGRIAFASTRIGTFEEYHQPPSRALFVMDADGGDIHPVTSTILFDSEPKVTADGRIAFIRTDNFFDRAKVETRIHAIRPDGTQGMTAAGADVGAAYGTRLRAFGYGSPAPLPDGRLAFLSNQGNRIGKPGGAEGDGRRLPDGLGDLAPLPDGRLLCTVSRPDGRRSVTDVIGVLDPRDGRIVRIHTSPSGSVHSPAYLGARPRPPVLPDAVDRRLADDPDATGFLLCDDVRFTTKTAADWAQIRAVRVLAAEPLTTRSSHSHIVHAGHVSRELGVVPLASDGSFFVEVPADTPLALQAVDAEGRSELNEMSWIYVRPGERRSCTGCHAPRQAAPSSVRRPPEAMRSPPLRLLGQGRPHRFRGNNPGVTGMMDLQFERFRETASVDLHARDPELRALLGELDGGDAALRISAAHRLGLLRDRAAAPALAARLRDGSREARVAAAMALASCGTRESAPPLRMALDDPDPLVARAAEIALENLTGQAGPEDDWDARERELIRRLDDPDRAGRRRAILALGHMGGDAARAALRRYVAGEIVRNPYPPFEKHNRTDQFTFAADSPLNPRTLQAAVRALGRLQDGEAVAPLADALARNLEPKTADLFLAEAAIEALGRIATPAAESVLIGAFGRLEEYWQYVGWYSDHPALYACHASPLHARILQALDALGSTAVAGIVPHILRSVPTDPDRALLQENDDYETVAGRIVRRSGRGDEVIETCLSVLGDPKAVASAGLREALGAVHAAWAGRPGPENRAAQTLSWVCRDRRYEPRVRAAFERYLARPEEPVARTLGNPEGGWTPVRHWTLFYLARALGNLADPASVDALRAVLRPALHEARHGRPDPSRPEIHFLQLDYTPCWRAAAAHALGRIGDARAVPDLLAAAAHLDNATDVRHAAAVALGAIADPAARDAIRALAKDYPEVSTRRALLRAAAGPAADQDVR